VSGRSRPSRGRCPTRIAELRKKRDHYLPFLDYPLPLRRAFSTTNAVEAVNGQLERLRLNNGGYFQSESNLQLKLGIATRFLQDGKWRSPAAAVREVLPQLNAIFERRFEALP
jgi:transposase-like protein